MFNFWINKISRASVTNFCKHKKTKKLPYICHSSRTLWGENEAGKKTAPPPKKSTNMVQVSSIECTGPEVRRGIEATRFAHMSRQKLWSSWPPARMFHRGRCTKQSQHAVQMGLWGAPRKTAAHKHSGKNSTNLFCILSANTSTKGFPSFCWFCIFSSSLLEAEVL